ncbi:alpha-1,6-mannosyltransferase [Actinoalloteichus hoggarensis]|uniref:polyprenol phosphomannose-dependent alpha 1,6 mannosyltransferase MptB n=1 Tax=Actinoalloteichus hoggarensis TaxID=1470176 RepID=UPI001823E733|nr:polyprenol phosphomannose-dependent alpha 1,6 mannosyltransferase MptB [Actinoalloteichus hoggarensis]MBB5923769.1 alpha-1,6-mannosyltransferase [Actinoalloteichus hoggarensis]
MDTRSWNQDCGRPSAPGRLWDHGAAMRGHDAPTTTAVTTSAAGRTALSPPNHPSREHAVSNAPDRLHLFRRLAVFRRLVPLRIVLIGATGSVLIALGAVGAAGVLNHDPLLAGSGLSWVRFGHGRDLATGLLYLGLGLLVWAWVRLGREVRIERVGTHGVLAAIGGWLLPLMFTPPLFSRDAYSYLAQGNLAAHGIDPYEMGPAALPGPLADNVSWVWQNTPAPYGPLFILVAKTVVMITGQNLILGVLLMRLVMVLGLVLMCWALPGLARHLGGRGDVALWLAAANPLMLVHLVGGPHNDLLMVGLLAAGVLVTLDRRHVLGIVLIMLAAAMKATAVIALPFMVWIWTARLHGSARSRFLRAASATLAVSLAVFTACTLVAGVDLGWISALQTSSLIVNWLSVPTAVAQIAHLVTGWFVSASLPGFLTVTRMLGFAAFAAVALWQWWKARRGGPEAVYHATITLFALALLSPATLPWYFSWPLALAAALKWPGSATVAAVCGSVWLLLVTFPSGDTALYSWFYLLGALGVSVLAAVSLVRPDPLRLSSRDRRAHPVGSPPSSG